MVVHMKRAYWKDIWRTVTKEKKRFISIAVIAALGVTMMCGLRAACVDLRYSADRFYDEQNLFDVRVLSTLGLTDEDMAKFSDFAIRYHQLHKGEEMFLIWENIPDKNPGLLYAVNVTADSYLTAMQEAIDLIARKF